MGWFVLLTCTETGGIIKGNIARANPGPATDLFPSWIISPTAAVLLPSPKPTPITKIVGTPSTPITVSVLPRIPWDTLYAKPGSVFQDRASGTYRMYYESATYISDTDVLGNPIVGNGPSGIGLAVSLDGITWTKPITDKPIFAASGQPTASVCPGDVPSAWDNAFVGSPRVIFDGNRYRMFYVASNTGVRFTGTGAGSIGVAESVDGINWCRAGRTTPVLIPSASGWDSLYVEPAGARLDGGVLKLYYTASDTTLVPRTGLVTSGNFPNTTTPSLVLTRASGIPISVNGATDHVKGVFTLKRNDQLLMWYSSNSSGTDLIYQTFGNSDTDFTRDPDAIILKPVTGSPNENLAQSDVAGVVIKEAVAGTTQGLAAQMWFTGVSSTNAQPLAFRAISPVPIQVTPGAVPPFTAIVVPTAFVVTPTPTPGIPALPPGISVGGPSSFYTPTPGEGAYPAFYELWKRVDDPVRAGLANRSWVFSGLPYGFRFLQERYEEGTRLVLYHDKGRMEAYGDGGITNGLLAKELISGLMQVGDNKFEPRVPANEAIAGDAIEVNPQNPAYFSLYNVASLNNDKRSPDRSGQIVTETINRAGAVGVDGSMGNYAVTYGVYEPRLGHNIANVFWDFINQQGTIFLGTGYTNGQVIDWLSVVGLPLTEPYWTKATVGGQLKDVMVQAFERRVLTYTPSNNDPFKVEMGNVGRHYFRWRYNLSQ
jgi:predicted GH43/DUF377 family glycosyl hydrolase